jgi:hypothetical protein
MRNISEVPFKWVIVKIENNDETHYKVFASWLGSYLDGDSWKINSGIKSIEEDEDNYYFIGFSGSQYKCNKKGYGVASSYTQSVLDDFIERSQGKIILMENQDWTKLEIPNV